MMKKLHLCFPAVVLMLCGTMASLTSCVNEIDNPTPVVVTDDKPFDRDQYVDASVRPGDDFYRYALGRWLDDETLPDFNTLAESILINIRDRAMLESSDPVMTAIRQLEAATEVDGSADLELFMSRIDMLSAISTQAELEAAVAQLHQLGYTPLLRLYCKPDDGVLTPFLIAAITPPNTNYSMTNHDLAGLSDDVHKICGRLSNIGFSDERIEEIYQHAMVIEELEMQIFLSNYDLDKWQTPLPTSRSRGTESSPIDRYLRLIGLDNLNTTIYYYTSFYPVLSQLLDILYAETDESIALMRDYLIYFVLGHDEPFVPQVTPNTWYYWRLYYAAHSHLYHLYRLETEVAGKEIMQKQTCSEMMEEFRQLLIERIDQLDWMTDATKQEAKTKARAMTFCIGYPDEWNEEFAPKIEGTTLLEAVSGMRRQAAEMQRKKAGRDMRTHGWDYVCSSYLFSTYGSKSISMANQLFIVPKNLMPPIFDTQQSEATLYAAATIFAHEMGHGFDSNGSRYDENGVVRNWWTDDDMAAFKLKQQQMITLWNQLEAYPGQPANGEKTLAENIADLCGVQLAYEAYKRRLENQGYSGEQMDEQLRKFWFAYAYLWASEDERDVNWLIWRYYNDVHSASHNRINGIVRLFDDWYRLFDVKPTDKLYLAPEDRVKIW